MHYLPTQINRNQRFTNLNILHIDSSPRGERSHSRALTTVFVAELQKSHPDASVAYRDLGHAPVPHVDEAWIKSAYSAPDERTEADKQAIAFSDELVDELLAADIIVLGAPMHNFSIPSTLKAYIDNVVRVGRTFTKDYEGLATGKKLFIFCARGGGGYAPGEPMHGNNFQDPYFKAIFGMIGISDISYIYDEKTLTGESDLEASKAQARELAQSVA